MDDQARPRTLLLLRHGATEDFRPGHPDRDRQLTDAGRAQAAGVGRRLRAEGLRVDRVLCSPAARTRQTLAGLRLDAPTDVVEAVYNAGSDTLLGLVRELSEEVQIALIVGHAPGLPRLTYELAGPGSAPSALAALERQFGTATLARLTVQGRWSKLVVGRLDALESTPADPADHLSTF